MISGLVSSGFCATNVHWRVCSVHPWVECDAEQLPAHLTKVADKIDLSGPRNDWLTGAVAIAADENSTVTVSLEDSKSLKRRIQIRVVGQVRNRETRKIVWDPLISKEDLPDKATKAYNFQQIKDFPMLHVTPKVPAFLWLTVDLRGAKSGLYKARIKFADNTGHATSVPINISVLDAELPVDNPLYCMGWQWTSSEKMVRDFVDHGINTAWKNQEMAWKAGAKFLLFQFSSSFNRKPIDDKQREEVKNELTEIWALVDWLKVPRDQWAINPADEPSDKTAQIDLEYANLIKSIRPDTPIWYDPAWGKAADSAQNSTTVDGTLKLLAPVTSVFCPYCWHLWDKSGAIDFMRLTGKPIWSYEILPSSADRRATVGKEALRTMPWMAWKYRLKGVGYYSANATDNDPWDDLAPGVEGYANYSFTYPGANGIMSSRGFEAVRQGMQEYKRLYMLRKLGADLRTLDAWAESGVSAPNVETYDELRAQMDKKLVELTANKCRK